MLLGFSGCGAFSKEERFSEFADCLVTSLSKHQSESDYFEKDFNIDAEMCNFSPKKRPVKLYSEYFTYKNVSENECRRWNNTQLKHLQAGRLNFISLDSGKSVIRKYTGDDKIICTNNYLKVEISDLKKFYSSSLEPKEQ